MRRVLLTMFTVLTVVMASAQVTTSGISGQVADNQETLIGATITACHQPSGTVYHAVTNVSGRYTIQGMRVGGPYQITVSYVGYQDKVIGNVILALGETKDVNVVMSEDAQQLSEVVVTGKKGKGAAGASTNFSLEQIENTPTVNRSIYDVARLSPLVTANKFGGVTIAGTNNRYNSFQVDGMVNNDVFGLAVEGTNGGQTGANPISIDAIEEVQVVASPFDVRQSGFTGGAINAITKSGTNEFKGSAYAYHTNENMYSRWSQLYNKESKLTQDNLNTNGFTFGGPILKDKLFFFANVEYVKDSYPEIYQPGKDGYFLNEAAAKAMVDRYRDLTGCNDGYGSRDIERKSLTLLGRIDWNITNKHRLTVRYQFNDSYRDNAPSTSTIYYFNESGYRMKNKTNSFVTELHSRLSDHMDNEFRFGGTFVRDNRQVAYSGPLIYIQNAGNNYDVTTNTDNVGTNQIGLGTEYSSGANRLKQNNWTLEDNLSWYLGDHALTFGTHNEFYDIKNVFIQAATGEYVYNGIPAFMASPDVPQSFIYKYSDESITGTSQWETPFKAGLLGFYVQDKWNITTALQLTYGLRIDIPLYLNTPSVNEEFNASSYSIDNDAVVGRRPKSMPMFSPRLGFRWYTNDQRTSLLRGGVGIFNGRAPFVWIENAWANTGIEMKGTTITDNTKTPQNEVPTLEAYGKKSPMEAAQSTTGKADKPVINTIDRKFRFPQVLRFNLAWEYQLPWDVNMTLEGMFSKNINDAWYENLALSDSGNPVYAVPGSEASATTYYNSNVGGYSNIINLTNTQKGYSYSLSAQLKKSFDFGLDLMASYTFARSYSVHDGPSSVAYSNWAYYYNKDKEPVLAPSLYDKPHRVMLQASYNSPKYGHGRWQTHVTLTYNGISGQRYSLLMGDDKSASFNGDYRKANTTLYIPTTAELQNMDFADIKDKSGNVTMSADAQRAAFEEWITHDDYAKDHRGEYATRNSNASPWENHFDLHLTQDFIYLKNRGSKIQFVVDIINVANLLNHDWGTTYADTKTVTVLKCANVKTDASGNRTAVFNFTKAESPAVDDIASRWHMQLGLRVTF